MVEITDIPFVEEWNEGAPFAAYSAVAARAALRSVPHLAGDIPKFDGGSLWEILALRCFRCVISACAGSVAAQQGRWETGRGLSLAVGHAWFEARENNDNTGFAYGIAVYAASALSNVDVYAAGRATGVLAEIQVGGGIRPHGVDAWKRSQMDAEMYDLHGDVEKVFATPTWHGATPEWVDHDERILWDVLNSHAWSYWRRWYTAMRDGVPPDWKMQEEIALIPHEVWRRGPEAIATKIAWIEARYLAAATPLAEQVVWMGEALDVEAVPVEDAPVYDNVLDKARDALSDVGWPGDLPQPYTGLGKTLAKIDRALGRYGNNPQRVHDDFVLAVASIDRLIVSGEIVDDEEVAALRQVLETGALDIRRSVPEVEAAVKARALQRLSELGADDAGRIEDAVEAVAAVATPAFAADVRADGAAALGREDASDPDVLRADPDERVGAAWRLRRRVPQSYLRMKERAIDGTAKTAKGLAVGNSLGTLASKIEPALGALWKILSGL